MGKMRDFYYSRKMLERVNRMDAVGKAKQAHTVLIDGKAKPFTIQVDPGKGHGSNWDDIVFVGTTSEDDINYKREKM